MKHLCFVTSILNCQSKECTTVLHATNYPDFPWKRDLRVSRSGMQSLRYLRFKFCKNEKESQAATGTCDRRLSALCPTVSQD